MVFVFVLSIFWHSLIDGIFIDCLVISSIDEILAEDEREMRSLLLSRCSLKLDSIVSSN